MLFSSLFGLSTWPQIHLPLVFLAVVDETLRCIPLVDYIKRTVVAAEKRADDVVFRFAANGEGPGKIEGACRMGNGLFEKENEL